MVDESSNEEVIEEIKTVEERKDEQALLEGERAGWKQFRWWLFIFVFGIVVGTLIYANLS